MVVSRTVPSAPSTPTRRAIAVTAATVAVGWGCIINSSSAGGDGAMYRVVAAHTVVARAIVAHAVVVRVVARVVVERAAVALAVAHVVLARIVVAWRRPRRLLFFTAAARGAVAVAVVTVAVAAPPRAALVVDAAFSPAERQCRGARRVAALVVRRGAAAPTRALALL